MKTDLLKIIWTLPRFSRYMFSKVNFWAVFAGVFIRGCVRLGLLVLLFGVIILLLTKGTSLSYILFILIVIMGLGLLGIETGE